MLLHSKHRVGSFPVASLSQTLEGISAPHTRHGVVLGMSLNPAYVMHMQGFEKRQAGWSSGVLGHMIRGGLRF